ncbi:hypothetical protein TIFTF001_021975 [Ficus carica]|uniref:Uncharacterized protein n=1 Tax=Ficus carica TaxID=3494 RepID=A0AA88DB92_FICCA|nr:hypothetical protein TIFTF001_021975 [Ficus carica]
MSLPASQYSVLDAERIERVDENTFRCYVYRIKFFAFEVCPVLLVRVEEQPKGCCIKLLSCKLEGSPIVAAQNDKFDAEEACGGRVGVVGLPGRGAGWPWLCNGLRRRLVRKRLVTETSVSMVVHEGGMLGDDDFGTSLDVSWIAFMENKISCDSNERDLSEQKLTSEAVIEVSIEIPFAFRPIPVQAIESTGAQVLEQVLRIMLPRFMAQLVKDYQAWASGDTSRQPLGTGKI